MYQGDLWYAVFDLVVEERENGQAPANDDCEEHDDVDDNNDDAWPEGVQIE
jgi:hypothetical protein